MPFRGTILQGKPCRQQQPLAHGRESRQQRILRQKRRLLQEVHDNAERALQAGTLRQLLRRKAPLVAEIFHHAHQKDQRPDSSGMDQPIRYPGSEKPAEKLNDERAGNCLSPQLPQPVIFWEIFQTPYGHDPERIQKKQVGRKPTCFFYLKEIYIY